MINKKFAVLFLVVLFSPALWAQQGQASSDYQLGADGKIQQRISWNRVNAYFYEVEIERQAQSETWVPEIKQRTENIFVELSLTPGMYRYRINTYNVLGKIAASSEWVGIRVFAAKAPAAVQFTPLSGSIDSKAEEFFLTISGADLAEGAVLYLSPGPDKKSITPSKLSYSDDETSIIASFPTSSLVLGSYEIVITNPGGIEQRLSGFKVDFERNTGFSVSLGYTPLVPLGGYLFEKYNKTFYPLGFYGRVSFVPLRRMWGSLGLELSPSMSSITTKHSSYTLKGQLWLGNVDVVYQKWFNQWTMALKLRAGGGLAAFTNIRFLFNDGTGAESGTEQTLLFAINGGASFEWMLWRGLFAEAGLDYLYCPSSRGSAPRFVRVSAGLGWRF
ncbi:hypothetical protein AGMMS50230_10140 [Spirochaetia bacterium]|nr:hypothetical protein AGMMS50230_10140 [Spirochaetia bacterium]